MILNPEWKFLNEELLGEWPPKNIYHRKDVKSGHYPC